jgi:hypothetical protein
MRADFERLAEGEPFLAGEAALGAGDPENEDVDACIGGRLVAALHGTTPAILDDHGCTHGTRPCSSSAMILLVIS